MKDLFKIMSQHKWFKHLLYAIIGFISITLIVCVIAYVINWLILRPQKFNFVGDGKDWLMFWGTFLSAIASFAMVSITWKTLKQNKEQLDELKHQWQESHLPEVSASLIKSGSKGYIRIFNISNVQINNLSIKIIHDPDAEVQKSIFKYNNFKEELEQTKFSIEPYGVRDFLLILSYYIDGLYPGYIELKCHYNDIYEKNIKMYFSELRLVATNFERSEFLDRLDKVSDKIGNIKL